MTKSRLIALACLALGIALAAPARAEIKIDGEEYLILREEDVLGVVEK